MKLFTKIALTGDALYILWILYNAIDEGFQHIASVQAVALLGLIILLGLNIMLLRKR